MITKEQVEKLSHNDDFVAFMQEIYATRESLIQQMHDRPDAALQQISGRTLACDDILALGGWKELVAKGRAKL